MPMYYHVIVETQDKNKRGDFERCYELNCINIDELIEDIVYPYTKQDIHRRSVYRVSESQITQDQKVRQNFRCFSKGSSEHCSTQCIFCLYARSHC